MHVRLKRILRDYAPTGDRLGQRPEARRLSAVYVFTSVCVEGDDERLHPMALGSPSRRAHVHVGLREH